MTGWPQSVQVAANTSRTSSGCSASARATPGRPLRTLRPRSGRFSFWLADGGREEFLGVLGGPLSCCSSSAMRACNLNNLEAVVAEEAVRRPDLPVEVFAADEHRLGLK